MFWVLTYFINDLSPNLEINNTLHFTEMNDIKRSDKIFVHKYNLNIKFTHIEDNILFNYTNIKDNRNNKDMISNIKYNFINKSFYEILNHINNDNFDFFTIKWA